MADEIVIGFVIEGAKDEGAEVDKALGFNSEAFATARFCFTSDFFSLFYSHYFLNASFVDQQYSSFLAKVANSQSSTLSYLCAVIQRVLRYLRSR